MGDDEITESYGDGGSWTRGRFLGEGSFGAVFLATSKSPSSEFQMAVKSAEILRSESLRHERSVLSSLVGCPNVIQCFGAEITHKKSDGSGVYNLLLEYGSGGTLLDRIKSTRGKGLPESEVRWYASSIVRGLLKIHQAGYVHCDLKPENILLVSTDQKGQKFTAKICDFGLAKTVKEDRQKMKLRRTWIGTPEYLPPEAVRHGLQEPPGDIWSLGMIVLEMLTGLPAWEQGSSRCAILRKLYYKSASLPTVPKDLSPVARSFLNMCIRRVVKNRATAKLLLRHPFISCFQDDDSAGSGFEDPANLVRNCIPSQFRPELVPRVAIPFI